jgi:hypothetical protein
MVGKAEAAARRNEKLARRNPDRLQKQLDELKAIETGGGKLTTHEQKILGELEKDLRAVRKAREVLGDKAPSFSSRGGRDEGRGGGVLGKRRRNGQFGRGDSDESDVPEDVKSIPMPRDTPPPISREVMDKWYQARREHQGRVDQADRRGTQANNIPLGENPRRLPQTERGSQSLRVATPVLEARTVYEAAPAIRDLRKEAVSAFVPAAVRIKMEKSKGKGGLVEPEEADQLERAGYLSGSHKKEQSTERPQHVMMEEVDEDS